MPPHTKNTGETQGSKGEEVILNSSPPLDRSRKWCFTLNNWTIEEYNDIVTQISQTNWIYIIGKETGKEGTPHLQGYIHAKNAVKFDRMKRLMPRAHLEPSKANDQQNYVYCSKEGDFVTNMNSDFRTKKEIMADKMTAHLNKTYNGVQWKNWQQAILNGVMESPDMRTIEWVCDVEGNSGKSYLARYLNWKFKTLILNGKQADMFNGIRNYLETNEDYPEICIIDTPRSSENYFSYGAIEKIKDGLLYSGKYEGGIIELLPLHVIVFANFMPDLSKMSEDRWNIIDLHCPDGLPCPDGHGQLVPAATQQGPVPPVTMIPGEGGTEPLTCIETKSLTAKKTSKPKNQKKIK